MLSIKIVPASNQEHCGQAQVLEGCMISTSGSKIDPNPLEDRFMLMKKGFRLKTIQNWK